MRFKDVIGQETTARRLLQLAREGRIPHALLFSGKTGYGTLAMALALAERLLCQSETEDGEPCGRCKGCLMAASYAHPDLHFSFPFIKPVGQSAMPVSDQFIEEWRTLIKESPYFTLQTWLKRIGVVNQQAIINVAESENIIRKLAITSSQGGYRIVVIWEADKMNAECANKLLKILEEPPAGTIFLLTSEHPERLLATIKSRVQEIPLPPISERAIAEALMRDGGLDTADAQRVAHNAEGDFIKAVEQTTVDEETAQYFDRFVLLMRLCYKRDIKELYNWSQEMAGWGRERQKAFLAYALRLVRENFVYNFGLAELNYMDEKEKSFAVHFARFINERNVIGIMEELSAAERDISRNVNGRMVFFDFSLKMIILLIQ